jgi:hypothetical protein
MRGTHTNSTSAASTRLLHFCMANRGDIQRIYGSGALPLPSDIKSTRRTAKRMSAPGVAHIDLTAPDVLRTTWGRNWQSITFIKKLLLFVFRRPNRLLLMVTHRPLLYALRLLGFIFSRMFVPDNPAKKHPIFVAVRYIIAALDITHQRTIAPYLTEDGYPKAINTLPSYSRHTFLHKFLTPMKRQLGQLMNDTITDRWEAAATLPHYLDYVVNPGPNYALQTALSEYAINKAVDLDLRDLIILAQYVAEYVSTNCRDVNLLHIFYNLRTMLNARFQTKVIEVNERDCTCHAKCMGQIGGSDTLTRLYTVMVRTHASTTVTAISRLSHKVDNTTSLKPKRYLHTHAPSIATCSGDGSSALRLISLYRLENIDSKGRFLYTHRFYTTNSIVFTDEIYRGALTTSTARIYGICFSGHRKCHKRLTTTIRSAKQQPRQAPLTDVISWYRCTRCASVNVYDESHHYGPHEAIHQKTCIDHFVTGVRDKSITYEEAALRICDGCVASFMCRHMLQGLVKNNTTVNLLLVILRLRLVIARTRCGGNKNE